MGAHEDQHAHLNDIAVADSPWVLPLQVPDQPTLRLLNLASPSRSRLRFPEWGTTTWEPVKDPMHALDGAYANPVPHWML